MVARGTRQARKPPAKAATRKRSRDSSAHVDPDFEEADTETEEEEEEKEEEAAPAAAAAAPAKPPPRASPTKDKAAAPPGGQPAYRGVTHHIRTNRFEAHVWEGGKQLYLGGYDDAASAALAYDLCAVRFRGLAGAQTNFHASFYEPLAAALAAHSKDDLVAGLRRHSKGGAPPPSSAFRGVARHAKGRWEARIGAAGGKKYTYLGLHDTEFEAAQAYDRAALARAGAAAVTNFHVSEYAGELPPAVAAEAVAAGLMTAAEAAGGARRAAAGGASADALAEVLFGAICGGDGDAPSPLTVLPGGAARGGPAAAKPARGAAHVQVQVQAHAGSGAGDADELMLDAGDLAALGRGASGGDLFWQMMLADDPAGAGAA